MTLDGLGSRICIMGPSNSGKSTLAAAIGRAHGLHVVHLDQLHHYSHTDWQRRPEPEFIALHNEAIRASCWVMDGNYSKCLPRRLERATGVILLEVTAVLSLLRYLRRSWFERERRGALDSNRDSIKWVMIRHILTASRDNRRRYARVFDDLILPKVYLASSGELARFYRREGLHR